ncbi:protein SIEVE ELEMENT OCCLUSION B-like [Cornus florida]|uniref:protein SIEVE ELEMENT OCCLUSION B-like n=1 Tax=Cornus florida TaxID=4283 RepID=UPI0028968558|nr:protein SIEVE ELEMENT OCCLUSION B-like [Cornus florida]
MANKLTPAGSYLQPQTPTGSYLQPQTPAGSSLQPQTPAGSTLQPQTPTGSYLQSQTPTGSYLQPQTPAGSALQPQTSAGSYLYPQTPAGSYHQPQTPAGSYLHPQTPAGSALQLMKSPDRRSMFVSSDDSIMMRQILATHAPDGREVNVKPLLYVVEDILRRSTLNVDGLLLDGTQAQKENMEDKSNQAGVDLMLDSLLYTIERISCEMESKCLSGAEGHATTLPLFNVLSEFSWEAKLVLTLAAFALKYGEFWLLCQIYSSNQLAKSMAILRQLPIIMEHSGSLKSRFDALNNLIRAILDLTRCIVELKDLPSIYKQQEIPALTTANATIPTAVYWATRGVIVCAAQIINLSATGHNLQESWELSTLTHKINSILEHLRKQLFTCYQHIEEWRNVEAYDALQHIFEMIHIDNMKVLKALIYAKDDQPPLLDGVSKKRVNLEVLRRKNVLLLISGLDISQDELSVLEQIYNDSRIHAYEVVWMPIVEHWVQWTEPMQKQFESLQATMPWFSVNHPSLIEKPVIRFIKEKWHFRNKPILVVLDPQGKVLSPNAIHMMLIWGSGAFPFTSLREEALWNEEIWRLELLVNGIDQTILNWIRDGKYIFVYGGDDIAWIRKFTTTARSVALASGIPLEMVYVGKSSKREQVRRVISTIMMEKLSHCWQEMAMIWFFWTRLESMLFSKIQLGRGDDNDPMMQAIKKILSYDKSGGWAVLSNGSSVVINGHSSTVLPALSEYDMWKENISVKGFDPSIKEYHDKLHSAAHPCCRFEFPTTAGRIPENMKCPECLRSMEKHSTFVCCHDEGGAVSALY